MHCFYFDAGRCRSCTHTLFTVLRDGDEMRLVLGMLHEIVRP